MRNVLRISIIALTILFLFAGAANAVLIDLLGDEDGFGVGVPIGDGYHYLDYGVFYADNRDAGDPVFTDIWELGDKSWTHTYSLPSTPITSADLEVYVAGIADYSTWFADVYSGSVLLGTIPGIGTVLAHDLTRVLHFDLTPYITGSNTISIDVSANNDGYIIDYSKITASTSVPDASIMLLLGSSLFGLGLFSRKSKRS